MKWQIVINLISTIAVRSLQRKLYLMWTSYLYSYTSRYTWMRETISLHYITTIRNLVNWEATGVSSIVFTHLNYQCVAVRLGSSYKSFRNVDKDFSPKAQTQLTAVFHVVAASFLGLCDCAMCKLRELWTAKVQNHRNHTLVFSFSNCAHSKRSLVCTILSFSNSFGFSKIVFFFNMNDEIQFNF